MTTAAPPAPMPTVATAPCIPALRIITHKDLPESDGTVPHNFAENPQSALLNGTLAPVLERLHPDGQYMVGCDSFIYWRQTLPPVEGAKAPDWFLVVGVPPMLDGEPRRSYAQWAEGKQPLIVIEYVSGDGAEERDTTPFRGKFWVYENGIGAGYYAIHDGWRGTLEVWKRNGGGFHRMEPNAHGRFPVAELGVELGLWRGTLMGTETWWVRPWDSATGQMLPSLEEDRARMAIEQRRAEEAEGLVDHMRQEVEEATEQLTREREAAAEALRIAADRAAQERQAAEDARRSATSLAERAARLADLLRQAGIDPEAA